jgi:hypothetical protein
MGGDFTRGFQKNASPNNDLCVVYDLGASALYIGREIKRLQEGVLSDSGPETVFLKAPMLLHQER